MQVHDDESLANHIGSEPCTYGGDTVGEASAGECIGQPLSRENSNWDADGDDSPEGNMDMYAIATAWPTLRGPRPGPCADVPRLETRRSRDRPADRIAGPHREGIRSKPMTNSHEKSDLAIVAGKKWGQILF